MPGYRRSTRHQGRQSLVHNARYHPADDSLRPYQAARSKAKDWGDSSLKEGHTDDESNLDNSGAHNEISNESQQTDLDAIEDYDGDVLSPSSMPNRY